MASREEHKLYVGLGSNLDSPLQQVGQAIEELRQHPDFQLCAVSRLYRSKAIGPGEQDDYINAAVCLLTALPPESCLQQLQAIELRHKRQRSIRWGARTLDLDILLYGTLTLASTSVNIPHPRIAERNFVLRPLLDIDPELSLPDGRQLNALLHIIGERDLLALE